MGYWGWETRGNRIAWALVVTFVLLGAAFWIPGVIEVKKCTNGFNTCRCTGSQGCLNHDSTADKPRYQVCENAYASCIRRPAAVWGVGWFFLVLMSWAPCCYFCCCSKNPKNSSVYTPGVQMAGMPAPPSGPYGGVGAPGYAGNYAQAAPAAAAYPTAYPTQAPYDTNVPVHRY